jgi:hypothetical protein
VKGFCVTVVALTVALAGCGSSGGGGSSPASTSVSQIREALVARLEAKRLDYRWVVCLRSGRLFRSRQIVRCNVNFGDPHIEAYCGVLVGGKLRTNHEDPAIPCARDRVGWKAPITSS